MVNARHFSTEGVFSKPRFLVYHKRRTDRKECFNCWLCSCLLPERPTKINTLIWFNVQLCAKCMLTWAFFCLSLWNGERSNSFLCGSHFKNWWRLAAAARNDYNTGHLREIFCSGFINWCKYEIAIMSNFFQCQFEGANFSSLHSVYCLKLTQCEKINFIK